LYKANCRGSRSKKGVRHSVTQKREAPARPKERTRRGQKGKRRVPWEKEGRAAVSRRRHGLEGLRELGGGGVNGNDTEIRL